MQQWWRDMTKCKPSIYSLAQIKMSSVASSRSSGRDISRTSKMTTPRLSKLHVLLKGWNNGKSNNNNFRQLVGVGFNVNGDEEKGVSLNNNGYTGPPCIRFGRTNHHGVNKCHATKHSDSTMLHIDGDVKEAVGEVRDDVIFGTISNDVLGLTLKNTNASLNPKSPSRDSSPKSSLILLDSQSTIDVFATTNYYATYFLPQQQCTLSAMPGANPPTFRAISLGMCLVIP